MEVSSTVEVAPVQSEAEQQLVSALFDCLKLFEASTDCSSATD